ncbi:protein MLN51 homolog isoform X2 [Quercus lobata]|uniref:protein MLN51 homolog isoform X2 n=1 Tax=Quercus lobata TaxID=97700 RepID=UPI001244EE4F|nr:protein MLN51 homolog isoform X2 [Quercus lobata]
MAGMEEKKVQEEEEAEYESDSEAALQWAARRREASDEDESEKEGIESFRVVRIGGEDGSDGLDGAPEYYDQESYGDEVGEEMEEVEVEECEAQGSVGDEDEGRVSEVVVVNQEREEVLDVPRVGKFYMHDDRFGGKRRGRHWSTPGRVDLWKPQDEQQWKHDKFEQMALPETRIKELHGSWIPRGHHQGHIKDQGKGHGYIRANQSRPHDNFVNEDDSLRIVRGRGPVRYRPDLWRNHVRIVGGRGAIRSKPFMKSSDVVPPTKYESSGKFRGSTSDTNSARMLSHSSNIQCDSLASKNLISASSLGSASPLFTIVSSSSHEESLKQKINAHGRTNRYHPTFVPWDDTKCSNTSLQGKTLADSFDWDKLSIEDSSQTVAENYLTNLHLQSPMACTKYMVESPQLKGQRSSFSLSKKNSHQSNPSSNQVNRDPLQARPLVVQQRSTESTVQPPVQLYTQQLHPGSRSQPSSESWSPYSSEPVMLDSLPKSGKTEVALVGKESGAVQASKRGSFQYDGTIALHNNAANPSLLPGLQFGGLHHGGLADPAVCMAFPGYVSQSQVGFGNSEITWLPVLTGSAGTIGAAYHSPHVTLDDGYAAHFPGQSSSVGVSRNIAGTNKRSEGNRHPDRSENLSDEPSKRHFKPRRYSEMNFNKERE